MEEQQRTNLLIPSHRKLTEDEITALLQRHHLAGKSKLPKIKYKDPGLAGLEVEVGDVVEVTRHSFAGETKYYRLVVE
jgi:DNA-directed RNA polymerase subunit H (RpoH/RPB5)